MPKTSPAKAAIPRTGLFWLLIAQALVIAPLLLHIPLWIAGLWVVCVVWRIQVFRMRATFPKAIIKVAMMVSAAFAVYLSRGSLVGLDAGVALLITAFVLKLVELRSWRDALVLIYLGFFAVVTSYLFEDGMLAALYSILPVIALLAAWVGLQQTRLSQQPRRALTTGLTLFAQAIPLTVLLFVFFPRLDPLWSLPLPKDKGVTGLSEEMSPGDIAELSQSSALAFRASFTGDIPPQNKLYWRALTMSYFDGRSWRLGRSGMEFLQPEWQPRGPALPYSVMMQPSSQPWLFTLGVSEVDAPDVRMLGDFRVQRNRPIQRTYLYQATAWLDALTEPKLAPQKRNHYLQLPRVGNPRTREWAQQLRQQYPDDSALVQAMLRHFNQEPYYYTLRPPKLGDNSVDGFMFETRRGFCEHYASSMAFALRAAGIPARVVTGYQGGEVNAQGNYVQVRQFDAHAWVEYWRLGAGWQQVDPTFQVAPQRIEMSLQDALADEAELFDAGLFSPLNYRHVAWVNQLRMRWEHLNYRWQTQVLGYQAERQQAWLRDWFGSVNWQVIGVVLVIGLTAVMSLLALWVLKPWRERPDPVRRALLRFDRVMRRHGGVRSPEEGLRHFQARIKDAYSAPQQQALQAFVDDYERLVFAEQTVEYQQLQQRLDALSRALKRA